MFLERISDIDTEYAMRSRGRLAPFSFLEDDLTTLPRIRPRLVPWKSHLRTLAGSPKCLNRAVVKFVERDSRQIVFKEQRSINGWPTK